MQENPSPERHPKHQSSSVAPEPNPSPSRLASQFPRLSSRLRWPAVAFGALVVAVVLSVNLYRSHAATATTIAINGTSAGGIFDGVGAISGGGGNSRYLSDYPAAQQSDIMDYLFKPNFGASLQILKLEIGGDTNSTDGAEPSIEHSAGSINCNAGYEWQIAEAAKARNPGIKLYALAWGAPGWISGHTFASTDTINYLVAWLGCAKQHNLTIDYIGGQNEKAYNTTWYKNFRSALDAAGYSAVKLVAADQFPSSTGSTYSWQNTYNIATDMANDPALKAAVGVVGAHDVCGYPTDGLQCYSTATAQGLGVPLWISEAGHMDGNVGAPAIARAINRGYQDAKLTGYIQWPLLDAMPPSLSHETYGLITADEPWSGSYLTNHQIWAFAHTAQFTQPGWHYVNSGTGYLGGARSNGSYVTYKSTNNSDWSMVAETSTVTATQPITATISGGLSTQAVHVWASNLKSANPANWFVQLPDITPTGGVFSYNLPPGFLYTFTTTTGQAKGAPAAAPAAATLKLPYSDTFATMDQSNEANFFAAMSGSFEGAPCAGGVSGICLQQNTPTDPIDWGGAATPYTIVGDNSWSNYTVSSSVLFKQSGSSAGVIGRFSHQAGNPGNFNGYLFQVTDAGKWTIYKNNTGGSPSALATGSVAALGTGKWHTISLKLSGSTLTASIDGAQVGTASDGAYTYGPAGLDVGAFTNTWRIVQFRNFSATGSGTAGFTGPIYSGLVDRCLDNYQGLSTNNNKIELYSCNYNNGSQIYNLPGDGTIRINGKCLDVYQAGTANGTKVELYTCNGGANQKWTPVNGTLVNPVSGKCLDDTGSSTANGTQIEIYTCNGSDGQYWNIPQ